MRDPCYRTEVIMVLIDRFTRYPAIRKQIFTATKPNATRWSVRSMPEQTGLSKSTILRWLNLFGVQPQCQHQFKLSNDVFLIEKVRNIMGHCLNSLNHIRVSYLDKITLRAN